MLGVHKATASRILGRARRALNDVVDLQAAAARGGIRQDAVMSIDMSQEAVLRVVLPTLTETQIVYLYLYYGEFLSCAEIARLLEYDKSTVSRTLHRAVERITRAFHTTRVQLTGLHASASWRINSMWRITIWISCRRHRRSHSHIGEGQP